MLNAWKFHIEIGSIDARECGLNAVNSLENKRDLLMEQVGVEFRKLWQVHRFGKLYLNGCWFVCIFNYTKPVDLSARIANVATPEDDKTY